MELNLKHFSGKFFLDSKLFRKKVPFFSWREVIFMKEVKETFLLLRNKDWNLLKQTAVVNSDFQNVGRRVSHSISEI